MRPRPGKHADEQTLEAYLLGSLPPRNAKRIEEHLLACAECVQTSKKLEDYIRSVRAALGNGKARLRIAHKTQPG